MKTLKLKKKRELDFWAGKLSGGQSGTGYSMYLVHISEPTGLRRISIASFCLRINTTSDSLACSKIA